MMIKKIAAIILTVVMAFAMPVMPAGMADSKTGADTGAFSLLEDAAANGLLKGITGDIKPEDNHIYPDSVYSQAYNCIKLV